MAICTNLCQTSFDWHKRGADRAQTFARFAQKALSDIGVSPTKVYECPKHHVIIININKGFVFFARTFVETLKKLCIQMFAHRTLIKGAAKHSGWNDCALYSVKKKLVKKAYLKYGEHDMDPIQW